MIKSDTQEAAEEGRWRDTRSRIQETALALFTEQGYEATSLREIAEALGVTKAALYYHFRTKEDIITSMIVDRVAFIDELIEWAAAHPRTPENRREIVRRYAEGLHKGRHHEVMHFMQRNQTALKDHPTMGKMREKLMSLLDFLVDEGDPLTLKLKRSMALFAVHAVWFLLPGEEADEEARVAASIEVAMELIDS